MEWNKYEKEDIEHGARLKDSVSVQGQGVICLTGFKKYLRVGEYIELLVNKNETLIGLKPVRKSNKNTSKIRNMHESIVIKSASFIKMCGISKGRYKAHWDSEEKTIIIDLKKVDKSRVIKV